ncbi:extracellular serine/threonine protein kinase four-jointed [Homalodisca vitripennis]|uniref:extracellular serine/threonine protein kinase four-jointed n=1 Tax=Homalodisca vitripennis TaxID=197043 RepID=UPI001EE9B05A|nr:extracellular serine/threonine protein kinase four-jointed [Homalodisca vitripennis]
MAEFGSDVTRMLVDKSIMDLDKLYMEHHVVENRKITRDKKRDWKSRYFIMDFSSRTSYISYGDLVILSENKKPGTLTLKKAGFVLILLAAFILGFILGSGILLYLSTEQTSFSILREISNTNNTSPDSDIVLAPTSSMQSSKRFSREELIDGLFWSDSVERIIPRGFGDEDDRKWNDFVQRTAIVRIERGCGRMQNRLVIFEDGTRACCRYRQNTDQIQGEIFSYYLGRLLRLPNVVPSTLLMINSSDWQWMSVSNQLKTSQWAEDHPVVLTKFVDDLLPAHIPLALKTFTKDVLTTGTNDGVLLKGNDVLLNLFTNSDPKRTLDVAKWMKSDNDAIEMAQWSDLIIFDYLTANLDRVVNNLYNLQWNPDMLSSPTHNLQRVSVSDLLVFLDNESGLLHGYRLLDKYEPYHNLLLDALCVFRKSTIDAVTSLSTSKHLGSLLSRHLPAQDMLPSLPEKNVNFLNQRVRRILRQVEDCSRKLQLI